MKVALAALLVVHGLIHVLGTVRAFELAPVASLKGPISRAAGVLWGLTALLFGICAVLLFAAPERWWAPAAVAVVISQGLIVSAWRDARFGTLANLLVLVPVLVVGLRALPSSLPSTFDREVLAERSRARPTPPTVTEADLAGLPDQVAAYLRFAGAVGRPQINSLHITFSGGLREGPKDAWMPSHAEQLSFFEPSSRLFLIRATRAGVPFEALHLFKGPAATMRVRVASLFDVVDASGPEMNRSETVTLFNDICLLAPSRLIDPSIEWEPVAADRVRARFTREGQQISAVLRFDATGALRDFVSEDRARSADGKTYTVLPWSTPIERYQEFDGRQLPVRAEARWRLPEGEFAYAQFDIEQFQTNVD